MRYDHDGGWDYFNMSTCPLVLGPFIRHKNKPTFFEMWYSYCVFPIPKWEYNVEQTTTGRIMLGCWLPSIKEATDWLLYYKNKYKPGTPYPNGKGYYEFMGYHVVKRRKE